MAAASRRPSSSGPPTRCQRQFRRLWRSGMQPTPQMAANDDLVWKALPEVAEAVEAFLNPVLVSAACGLWQPADWLWKGDDS